MKPPESAFATALYASNPQFNSVAVSVGLTKCYSGGFLQADYIIFIVCRATKQWEAHRLKEERQALVQGILLSIRILTFFQGESFQSISQVVAKEGRLLAFTIFISSMSCRSQLKLSSSALILARQSKNATLPHPMSVRPFCISGHPRSLHIEYFRMNHQRLEI